MRVVKPLKLTVADHQALQELLEHRAEIVPMTTRVVKRRLEMVVLAAEGWRNQDIAKKVGVQPSVVAHWRKEFQLRYGKRPFPSISVETLMPYFADSPRSGRPPKMTPPDMPPL